MKKRLMALMTIVVIAGSACSNTAAPASSGAAASQPAASQPAAASAATATKLVVWARNYTVEAGKAQPWAPTRA